MNLQKVKTNPYPIALRLPAVNTGDKRLSPMICDQKFSLSYSAVESLIAGLHEVMPNRHSALRARLKHLKRLGFPTGVNTGRGVPAQYGADSVIHLLLAFELIQLGLTPERAVNLLREFGFVVVQAAGFVSQHILREQGTIGDQDFFLSLDPRGLASLTDPDSQAQADDPALPTVSWQFTDQIMSSLIESRRRSFVNVSMLLGSASILLERQGVSRHEFAEALFGWAASFEWSIAEP